MIYLKFNKMKLFKLNELIIKFDLRIQLLKVKQK